MYTLIVTAKLNDIDPQAWFASPVSPNCRTLGCTSCCPGFGKPRGIRTWPHRPALTPRYVFEPACSAAADLTSCGTRRMGTSIQQLGHEVRLIAPMYVKPFTRRQTSDARDAAAIVEAVRRPTMRFVAVNTAMVQARSMMFRARGLLIRQRTQTVNASRGHLAEFGPVAPRGVANVEQLWEAFWEAFAERVETLPELVHSPPKLFSHHQDVPPILVALS